MIRPMLAVLLLACAGCTPMHWVKSGSDAQQIALDEAECMREAWFEAQREAWLYGPRSALGMRDRFGRVIVVWPFPPYADTFAAERRLTDFCMRNRGYRLEPVPQAPG